MRSRHGLKFLFGFFILLVSLSAYGERHGGTMNVYSDSQTPDNNSLDQIHQDPQWQAKTLAQIEKNGGFPAPAMAEELKKALEDISAGRKPYGPAAELAMKWIDEVERNLPDPRKIVRKRGSQKSIGRP